MSDQITFVTNYMDDAIFQLPDVIDRAKRELADLDFDTIVGTGFSGGVVIPALAMALGVNYVLIRKDTDDSHHGAGRMLGTLGKRWLFVDDFVASGRTRERVLEKIQDALDGRFQPHTTTYVGDYLYACHDTERRVVLADPTEPDAAVDFTPPMVDDDGRDVDTPVPADASDVDLIYVDGQVEPVMKVTAPKSLAALLDEINGSIFTPTPCQTYSAAGGSRTSLFGQSTVF